MKFKLSFRRKKKNADEDDVMSEEESSGKSSASAKPSGGGAKLWLFLHFEKLMMLGVVVLIGLFVYGAINKLSLEKNQSPTDVETQVERINQRIETSKFSLATYPVPNFPARIEGARRTVEREEYGFGSIVGETLASQRKRSEPKYLPPQDVEAVAGHGVFWVREPSAVKQSVSVKVTDEVTVPHPKEAPQGGIPKPPTAKAEGRRWVAIVAKVPLQQQTSNFATNFMDAVGYNQQRDVPRYVGAQIQRLEVGPGKPLDWSTAKTWSHDEWLQLQSQHRRTWAPDVAALEVVPPEFVNSALIDPLGPLAFRSWRAWASHSEIPMVVSNPRRAAPARGAGGRPNRSTGQPVAPPPVAQPEFQLVRLFDFDVEPGKRYRYRLQLVLWNPNTPDLWEEMIATQETETPMGAVVARGTAAGEAGEAVADKRPAIPSRFLENPETMKSSAQRTSQWSEPTRVVQIPNDAQVFTGAIMPPAEKSLYETAQVIVRILEVAGGRISTCPMILARGGVVGGTAGVYRKKIETNELGVGRADLETGLVLLDMRGGDAKDPSEMLFLDPQGNLFTKSSADDERVVKQFLALQNGADESVKRAQDAGKKRPDGKNEAQRLLGG